MELLLEERTYHEESQLSAKASGSKLWAAGSIRLCVCECVCGHVCVCVCKKFNEDICYSQCTLKLFCGKQRSHWWQGRHKEQGKEETKGPGGREEWEGEVSLCLLLLGQLRQTIGMPWQQHSKQLLCANKCEACNNFHWQFSLSSCRNCHKKHMLRIAIDLLVKYIYLHIYIYIY